MKNEITDKKVIKEILDNAHILHIGLFDGDYPYVVPVNFAYVEIDGTYIFYAHGSTTGKKHDLIMQNNHCFIEAELNDGLYNNGNLPCDYGIYYKSIMAKGEAFYIDDLEEKKKALKILMIHETGEDFEFTDEMAKHVGIMKIVASELTAKGKIKNI